MSLRSPGRPFRTAALCCVSLKRAPCSFIASLCGFVLTVMYCIQFKMAAVKKLVQDIVYSLKETLNWNFNGISKSLDENNMFY